MGSLFVAVDNCCLITGLSRSGKSCRLRWMNYLRPDIKHGNYTKEEEDTIIKTRQQHGNKFVLLFTFITCSIFS